METPDSGPIRDALLAFQTECSSLLAALMSGGYDREPARAQLIDQLLEVGNIPDSAFADDDVVSVMLEGRLRRSEAVLALQIELELRSLAESGPVTEAHIHTLTARLRSGCRASRNRDDQVLTDDNCGLRALKRSRNSETKPILDVKPILATLRSRKPSRIRCLKKRRSS